MAYPASPTTNLPQYSGPGAFNTQSEPNTPAPFAPQPPPGTPRLGAVNPIHAIPDMPLVASHAPTGAAIQQPVGRTGPRTESGMNAPAQALPVQGSRPWGKDDNPQADYLQQAIDIYASMDTGTVGTQPGGPQVSITEEGPVDDSSWRNRLYAERAATANRGSYAAGGGAPGQQRPRDPYQALKTPDMPTFQGEEYAPPERDQAIYDQERRRSMGPGMRALREGTREAISSSQSLDNPNARSKFIQQALHGYGQGLESVASQADRQATMTADRRQAEAVSMYQTKYEYKRNEDLMNYKTEISTIAADFAAESAASVANYNAGFGQGSGTADGTGGSPNARSKSTYYGNNPNMGYFGMSG